jgi:hypothetical protein
MWADRRIRLMAGAVLLLSFLYWNRVFDSGVVVGMERYVAAQREHAAGHRPFVPMQDMMGEAVAESARRATLRTLPFAVVGLTAVWILARR